MRLHHLFLLVIAFLLTGCDTFFTVSGTVTDFRTGAPIAGARATLVLDRGVGEQDQIWITDETGRIGFVMNEPEEAWATLTVVKANYGTWSTQFRGAPRSEVGIRLVPVGVDSGAEYGADPRAATK